MAKRVLIVGAGASGLLSMKCCLDEGLDPVCLERTYEMGGLWNYKEEVTDGQSCVMKTTVINTSKEMMSFSDFPIPAEFPNFMHNTKVMDYFRLYAKHFDLMKHVQFGQEILKVKPADDFSNNGQWVADIRDKKSGDERTETFDAVMVCTGHHADKNRPTFEGEDEFEGKVVHTHDYRHHKGLEDKKVVVVGIGNSGGDVAVELSRIAKQVYLSTRSGAWVHHRVGDSGYPLDMQNLNRVMMSAMEIVPSSVKNFLAEAKLNARFDHALYGLKPKHRWDAAHPMVNDELPNRIICGSIILKNNIKRLTKTGVEFEDGTFVEDVDTIVLATGYQFGFPYIEHEALSVKKNQVNLFKYVFPPDVQPGTIAVIGCIQPWGAIMPIAELQCRWAARVFKGVTFLPSPGDMWTDIREKQADMAQRYLNTPRHTVQVDWIQFMDQLAEQIGCKPEAFPLLTRDPSLFFKVFLGPCTPYQYRLMGPGAWAGAKEAINTQWERVGKPLKTRKGEPGSGQLIKHIILIVLLGLFVRWFLNLFY